VRQIVILDEIDVLTTPKQHEQLLSNRETPRREQILSSSHPKIAASGANILRKPECHGATSSIIKQANLSLLVSTQLQQSCWYSVVAFNKHPPPPLLSLNARRFPETLRAVGLECLCLLQLQMLAFAVQHPSYTSRCNQSLCNAWNHGGT
jgi:hypothetical protein